MKDIPMRNLKTLLATSALAFVAAVASVHAENGFTASNNPTTGDRVLTATISSPSTVAGPAQLNNCDSILSVYRRSNAVNNGSTNSVAVGADSAISVTVAAVTSATNIASRTDVTGGGCFVWAAVAPSVGASETTTFKIFERRRVTETKFQ